MSPKPITSYVRYTFSLRSLLLIVTAVCVWLGWNAKTVRERREILTEIAQHIPPQRFLLSRIETLETAPDKSILQSNYPYEFARVSAIRRLFGDESFLSIGIMASPSAFDPQLIARMEAAFPEARLFFLTELEPAYFNQTDFRDSLYAPAGHRQNNMGTVFKTGQFPSRSSSDL